MEKEVKRIDKNGEETANSISYRSQFVIVLATMFEFKVSCA